jgi:polar amino acid transport system substrate-binding protein
MVDPSTCSAKCPAESVLMRGVRILTAALVVGLSACTSTPKRAPDATSPVAEVSEAIVTEVEPEEELELTFDSAAQPVSTEVRLVTSGTLTACVDSPYAPFLYSKQSDGEDLSGIDVDVVTAIASNNKLTPVFVEVPFETIFDALKRGTCDVVASAVPATPLRKRTFDFSTPYFRMSQSLLVRSGQLATFSSLDALSGKFVGVQTATIGADRVRSEAPNTGVLIKEFAGRREMLSELKAGKIDAVLADSSINGFDAEESDGALVVSALLSGGEEDYSLVIDPTNPVLTETINRSLQRLTERGLLRKIAIRYVGSRALSPLPAG